MSLQWVNIIAYMMLFLFIIILCEVLFFRFKLQNDNTRQLAHFLSSMASIGFIACFDSHWNVFVLGFLSFLLLFFARYFNIFPSINGVKRVTYGSFLLPVAIYFSFLASDLLGDTSFFVLPVLILGISDPVAALFGKHFSKGSSIRFMDKSMSGSLTFLVSSFLISICFLYFRYDLSLLSALLFAGIFAAATALAELLSPSGYDNLTVPIMTVAILLLLTWQGFL